jgi:hypothetical protein
MRERGQDLDMATATASMMRVVEYVWRLELTQARWDRVAGIIETAIGATAARDPDGLRRAAEQLMLASPVRVIKPDGSPTASASPELLERTNVLIHSLQSMQPASGEGATQGSDGH